MTAEVAIINSGAVAIAADSAVTIGQQKIYNSALKVFSLSKVAPVGIMVYGNAGLLNVPWEPLLKTYREELADWEFDTLDEYVDDFFEYIAGHKRFFPTDAKHGWIQGSVGSYYLFMRQEVESKIREIVKKTGSVTDRRTQSELLRVVDRHHDSAK